MQHANTHVTRGRMLMSQRRYDLAEKEFGQAIAADPRDPEAFAMMALCLGELQKWEPATDAARQAVALAPDWSYGHYVLSSLYEDRNMIDEARAAIEEALRLDPSDADCWAMRARIALAQRDHEGALKAAEAGLECDAEHEACINLRSLALTNLGRRQEAGEAIAATLARNPLNASSHANMGWTLLHDGKPRPAMEHFREALRLAPDMEWARSGVMEAMKARSPIYRVFLAYFLFMGRLSGRAQWLIIIGAFVGFKVLGAVKNSNAAAAPFLTPLIIAYMVFALGTIVAVPLFNLVLFVDPFGRHVLRPAQRIGAAVFGLSLIPPVVFLTMWAVIGGSYYELGSLVTAMLIIPVSLAGLMREGKPRVTMIALAAGLAAMCVVILTMPMLLAPSVVGAYAIGCFGSTWIANFLTSSSPAKKY
ncbi:MAG: hypothetical protein GIKADHBN_02138 [Phycisphaerales bacterium]|nr:hypothetical protein [Phycisphaerales bacterium]